MPDTASSLRAPFALLYLPPLGVRRNNELDVLGHKLANALDRQSSHGPSRYESVLALRDAPGGPRSFCRILRRSPSNPKPQPVADVYMVDYRDTLLARHRGRVLLTRCLLAAVGALELARRHGLHLLGRRPRRATRQEVFQTFIVLGGMALVLAYLAVLVLSAARLASGLATPGAATPAATAASSSSSPSSTAAAEASRRAIRPHAATETWDVQLGTNAGAPARNLPSSVPPSPGIRGPSADPSEWGWESLWRGWSGGYVWAGLVASLVLARQLLARDRSALVAWITRMSEEMLAFVFYFGLGDRRAEVTGMVDEHVERLLEEEEGYERVGLMGYSFGSIVALDVLFPADNLRARRLERVDTLVTIGCPVAFILTYWPGYYAGRCHVKRPLRTWANVFSPVDVLATEFNPGPPEPGQVRLAPVHGTPDTLGRGPDREHAFREGAVEGRLTWFGALTLLGIRAHEMYWSPDLGHERNGLHLIVPDLFPGEVQPMKSREEAAGERP
ncbi:MAG: hypothetical protein ACKOEQ_05115 [Verrucomicrobiota bacterium]